jgi:transketolase
MFEPGELRRKADWVRRQTLLLHKRCPDTRLASSLSCVEILTVLHYGGILRFDPANPRWEGRDRFIVSKGHGSISYYPILADLGFIPPGELDLIARDDGVLKVIPDTAIAGYETINGSLGQGPGVACGIALGLKEKGSASRVFVLTGDGELNEGSVWEAVMLAAHHGLDNLVLVVDANGACMLDFCRNVLDLAPLAEKFAAFGWKAVKADGHDPASLAAAFSAVGRTPGRPLAVIAETVKGKGVPRLEIDPLSHIKALTAGEVDALLGEEP